MIYKPLPFREGSTLIAKYEEPFKDRLGNRAIITKCDFKRNNKVKKGYVLYVKWIT